MCSTYARTYAQHKTVDTPSCMGLWVSWIVVTQWLHNEQAPISALHITDLHRPTIQSINQIIYC